MWPFGKRLSEQDGMEKYRRWLRRWLLGSWWYYALVSTIVVGLVVGLIWAALNSWQSAGPAPGVGPGVELMQSPPGDTLPTGVNQPSNRKELEKDGMDNARQETDTVTAGKFTLYAPVEGRLSRGYGRGFSKTYGDYRFNEGVEFSGTAGAPVKAAAARIVKTVTPGAAVRQPVVETNVALANKPGARGGQVRTAPVTYTVAVDHGNGIQTVYLGLG